MLRWTISQERNITERFPKKTHYIAPTVGRSGAISREDLAAVMVQAIIDRDASLRFDLCVGDGAPTTDLAALLESARNVWLQH